MSDIDIGTVVTTVLTVWSPCAGPGYRVLVPGAGRKSAGLS